MQRLPSMCCGATLEICTVQGPFTWVAHYKGLSCYKRAQRPLLIDRDKRGNSLVINQSGSDTYSTVSFVEPIKHPCIHLRWMPNGYIGLCLIKVVHNIISACGKMTT